MFLFFNTLFLGCGDETSEPSKVTNGVDGTNGADGVDGSNGANGANGITTIFDAQEEPPGVNCETGGTAITYGLDLNANGILDVGEAVSVFYLCDGIDGETPESPVNYWGGSDESPFTYEGDLSFSHFGEMLAFCASYVAIDGDLTISSTLLTHTEDLECLEAISGDIYIENNSRLESLRLENLHILGGGITVRDNAILDTILFDTLEHTNTSIDIQNHELLSSIQMPNLEFIGFDFLQEGDLILQNNPNLVDIGMEQLQVIQNNLHIDTSGLVDISNLSMLTHVGDNFVLSNNSALQTLSSLTSLERVGQDMLIFDNPSLLNVDGLSGYQFVGGTLEIQNNEQLLSVNVPSLSYIGSTNGMTVSNNPLVQAIVMSSLYTTYGDIRLESNDALSVININSIEELHNLYIVNNIQLTGIDLSMLNDIQELYISGNEALVTLDLTALDIATKIDITNNILLETVDLSNFTTLRRQISVSEHPVLTSFTMTSLSSLEHQNWFGEYYYIISFVNNPQLVVDQTFFSDVILSSLGNTCEAFGYTCTNYSGNL